MIGSRSFCVLLLAALSEAVSPTVDVGYAKYKGQALPNGLTQWLGMRYAAPPTGKLRFQPPQDPSEEDGVQPADKVRPVQLNKSPLYYTKY